MFFRIAGKAFIHRRSRIAVATLALSVGAAVTAAMLSVYYDATRKMRSELRAYGANVMIAPAPGQAFLSQDTVDQISREHWPAEIAAAAPSLYIVATERTGASSNRVVIDGTWIDAARKINPWWKVDGDWITDRGNLFHCLVGARLARQLRLGLGQQITLQYHDRSLEDAGANGHGGKSVSSVNEAGAKVEVAGILSTGGPEEDQILISLPAAQELSGLTDQLSAVAISALGDTGQIESLAAQLNTRLPGARADLVRQIAEAEGRVLGKLRMTMLLVTLVMLAAAALSVSTTLAALVMERRKEIGTMKAIGAGSERLLRLFLFELASLGVGGGIIGYTVGIALAQAMGRSLFGVGVAPRIQVFGAVLAISLLVALISGIIPMKRMREVQPALILKGD